MCSISSELLIAISQVVAYGTFQTATLALVCIWFWYFCGFWWLEMDFLWFGWDTWCGISGVFVANSWEDRGGLGVGEKEGSLRERERDRIEFLEKEKETNKTEKERMRSFNKQNRS